ncbi:MAG TPA: non-canonical purine NTP pyrophosphatase [Verrucomicrobiae bacterium]|jgi:XTP/dITP diphosphohydrolase|nr:non-canonical purine NTP pyrophosphatase [Verrucomicrobiae bacterium]
MSKKSAKIAALIESCRGQDLNAHYLGYFACFNEGLFYEAHDVLEELWLADRQGPNYAFHKGLIQLAGAFVHLQKNRLRPSSALFKLAQTNLKKYPAHHEHLDVERVLDVIEEWMRELEEKQFSVNPLIGGKAPQIKLKPRATLLIATRNAHKVGEILAILSERFHYLTLRDFPDAPEVVEDATTFAGNATKKAVELARWLAKQPGANALVSSNLFVLADDSGLEVDALNGAPGVYSARFAALDTNQPGNSPDADNNAKLLRLLRDVPPGKRTARFRCVLALTPAIDLIEQNTSPVCSADEFEFQTQLFDGACEGEIALKSSGAGGFGYDPLFIPTGHSQSFAELGEEIKNALSHRAKALAKLRAYLNSLVAC